MGGLKQIMYGATDFARMRAGNAYFVDRTDLIRDLEKTSYTVFPRPRIFDISKDLYAFARKGDWRKALETACEIVSSYWAVREEVYARSA